jgi:hypothetical protein
VRAAPRLCRWAQTQCTESARREPPAPPAHLSATSACAKRGGAAPTAPPPRGPCHATSESGRAASVAFCSVRLAQNAPAGEGGRKNSASPLAFAWAAAQGRGAAEGPARVHTVIWQKGRG